MERLTIDEIIGHCNREARMYEKACDIKYLETTAMSNMIKEYWEHKQVAGYLKKLKDYEDAEEQGLLLRLPCKEAWSQSGDEVYLIYEDVIIECIHWGLSIDPVDGKAYIALATDEDIFPYRNPDPEHDLDPTDWCTHATDVEVNEIGKRLFFTRDEAEAKLKEMEDIDYEGE